MPGVGGCAPHEGSLAPSPGDEPLRLEPGQGLADCCSGETEPKTHIRFRRQTVAILELAQSNGALEQQRELEVEGNR